MKKILALVFCVCMMLSLVACGTTPAETTGANQDTQAPEVKDAEYKLGLGVVVSTASSKAGTAQVDATIATVDANGVWVK